jgi:hypothetical protein
MIVRSDKAVKSTAIMRAETPTKLSVILITGGVPGLMKRIIANITRRTGIMDNTTRLIDQLRQKFITARPDPSINNRLGCTMPLTGMPIISTCLLKG